MNKKKGGGIIMGKVKEQIQAKGVYANQEVFIIDVRADSYGNTQYLIALSFPIWIDSSYITNLVWLA
jgi:hypothetical protein